jgi:xylulokinase
MGGGARSPTWRQIIADVTGLTVEVMENGDASFGAALLAGIGTGLFPTPAAAIATCVCPLSHHEPNLKNHALYSKLFEIYKTVQAALALPNHLLYKCQTD